MVRKASEFNLDELKLSKRTYNCVKDILPEELVLLVRRQDLHVKGMWKVCYDELYAAVDAAGFIRHDFDPRSFGAAIVYRCVLADGSIGRPYGHLWNFESNEAYEQYVNLSQAQLDAVNQILDELGEEKKSVLQLRFGLVDGVRRTQEDVAFALSGNEEYCLLDFDESNLFDECDIFEGGFEEYSDFDGDSSPIPSISLGDIRRIEAKAFRMLRKSSRLSRLEAILMHP